MTLKSLDSCKIKRQVYCIAALDGDPLLVRRLQELGFHQGQKLELLLRAPFGGPLVIAMGTSVLSLRSQEAQCVKVQEGQ
jgi:Fe2+ transport system protein FeoA